MRKIKLALHWQILIGIGLGVLFGLFALNTSTIPNGWGIFPEGTQNGSHTTRFQRIGNGVSNCGQSR